LTTEAGLDQSIWQDMLVRIYSLCVKMRFLKGHCCKIVWCRFKNSGIFVRNTLETSASDHSGLYSRNAPLSFLPFSCPGLVEPKIEKNSVPRCSNGLLFQPRELKKYIFNLNSTSSDLFQSIGMDNCVLEKIKNVN
jgi:hypothetical protein